MRRVLPLVHKTWRICSGEIASLIVLQVRMARSDTNSPPATMLIMSSRLRQLYSGLKSGSGPFDFLTRGSGGGGGAAESNPAALAYNLGFPLFVGAEAAGGLGSLMGCRGAGRAFKVQDLVGCVM